MAAQKKNHNENNLPVCVHVLKNMKKLFPGLFLVITPETELFIFVKALFGSIMQYRLYNVRSYRLLILRIRTVFIKECDRLFTKDMCRFAFAEL